MSAHTPGPWRASWGRYLPILAIINGKDAQIGRAESFGQISDAECEANASLIAAAPDLLAALKAATEHMDRAGADGYAMPECPWCHSQREDNEHNADCEVLIARAAIAKAEGKS